MIAIEFSMNKVDYYREQWERSPHGQNVVEAMPPSIAPKEFCYFIFSKL